MNKKLVRYRIIFKFGNKDYLDKDSDWTAAYLSQQQIDKLKDSWDMKYTTYNSIVEDIDKLPYTRLRRGLFGEHIYIHFPYDIEPYQIYNNKSGYLPLQVSVEVQDYNPSLTELASELDVHSMIEFLKDKGFRGELKI